jgi:hypothetical protein
VSDRGVQAALVLGAVAAAGLAALGLAWGGAAAQIYVGLQMPYVASGVLSGVALAGTCLGLLAVHLERRSQALDRLDLDRAVRVTAELADTLPRALARRAGSTLVVNGQTVHRASCRFVANRSLPRARSAAGFRACRICKPV